MAALVVQYNLPYIAVQNCSIEKETPGLIPAETARKLHVLPLDEVGNVLSVVMADPLSEKIRAQLLEITQCAIVPLIGTKTEIQAAISRWYK